MTDSDQHNNSSTSLDDTRSALKQKEEAELLNDTKDLDNMLYPEVSRHTKPPLELGAGLLESLDIYAAKLLDHGLTGIEQCCTGNHRANKLLAQHEKHHGHHHHASNDHTGNDHAANPAPGNIPRKPGSGNQIG
jgi:hypothetical protein